MGFWRLCESNGLSTTRDRDRDVANGFFGKQLDEELDGKASSEIIAAAQNELCGVQDKMNPSSTAQRSQKVEAPEEEEPPQSEILDESSKSEEQKVWDEYVQGVQAKGDPQKKYNLENYVRLCEAKGLTYDDAYCVF